MWTERWFLSCNAKDIGTLYLIFALFSGLILVKPESYHAICLEGLLILLSFEYKQNIFSMLRKTRNNFKDLWADNHRNECVSAHWSKKLSVLSTSWSFEILQAPLDQFEVRNWKIKLLVSSIIFYILLFIIDSSSFLSFCFGIPYDFNLCFMIPVKIYDNIKSDKNRILQENKNKSGIYCFTNLIDGKKYIGSAVKITRRLRKYFSISSIEYELSKGRSHIYSAILKHGLDNFSLSILDYCESPCVIFWEQYHIDASLPLYNILAKAGSSKGFKHSLETRKKMSEIQKEIENSGRFKTGEAHPMYGKTGEQHPFFGRTGANHPMFGKKGKDHPMFGKKHSLGTLEQMRAAKQGEKNPMFGQSRPEGAGKPCQRLEVFDKDTNETTLYPSISEAAIALNINPRRIFMYFSRNQVKPYKKRYIFTKVDA